MLTVITAPATSDLTTLAAVKTELGLSGTADDAWLSLIIAAQSAAIAAHCNRTFGRGSYSEIYRPRPLSGGYTWVPRPRVSLSAWPVAAVSSVTEGGTALTSTDWELDAPAGIVWRLDSAGNQVSWPNSLLVVAYTAGWLLPNDASRNLPADIERAAVLAVKAAYFSRSRDPFVKAEDVTGVLSQQFWVGGLPGGDALPAESIAMLAPYVAPVLA